MFAIRINLHLSKGLFKSLILGEPTGVLPYPHYIALNDDGQEFAESGDWLSQVPDLMPSYITFSTKLGFDTFMETLLSTALSLSSTPRRSRTFRICSDLKDRSIATDLIMVTWVYSESCSSPKYETSIVEKKNSVWISISPCLSSRETWRGKEEG